MKTIQMTLDEDLLAEVDKLVRELNTTRSALTRDALRSALKQHHEQQLERRHREGYDKAPVLPGEFTVPEHDRAWGDEW